MWRQQTLRLLKAKRPHIFTWKVPLDSLAALLMQCISCSTCLTCWAGLGPGISDTCHEGLQSQGAPSSLYFSLYIFIQLFTFFFFFFFPQKHTSALICGKELFSWFNIIGSQEEASADGNIQFKGAVCSFGEEEKKTDYLCLQKLNKKKTSLFW